MVGVMTVSTVQAIAGGIAAAILGLAILTGSAVGILFALITALPILWVSLQHGVRPGLLAAGISVAVQGLMLGPVAVIGQGLFNAAPAALLGGLAGRIGLGAALGWLTVWFLALFLGIMLLAAGQPGGLPGLIGSVAPIVIQDLATVTGGPEMTVLTGMLDLLPGLSAVSLMLVLLVNLALASRLVRGFTRPAIGFGDARLPGWLVDGLVVAALLSLLSGIPGYIGGNAMLILGVAPLVIGLAVAHRLCRSGFGGLPMLIVIYTLLVMVPPMVVAVAGLGLIDHWVGIRRRLPAASPTKED